MSALSKISPKVPKLRSCAKKSMTWVMGLNSITPCMIHVGTHGLHFPKRFPMKINRDHDSVGHASASPMIVGNFTTKSHFFNPSRVLRWSTSGAVEPRVRITFLIKSRKFLLPVFHLSISKTDGIDLGRFIPSLFDEVPYFFKQRSYELRQKHLTKLDRQTASLQTVQEATK